MKLVFLSKIFDLATVYKDIKFKQTEIIQKKQDKKKSQKRRYKKDEESQNKEKTNKLEEVDDTRIS